MSYATVLCEKRRIRRKRIARKKCSEAEYECPLYYLFDYSHGQKNEDKGDLSDENDTGKI